jgi:hypothetical protein
MINGKIQRVSFFWKIGYTINRKQSGEIPESISDNEGKEYPEEASIQRTRKGENLAGEHRRRRS